VQPSADETYDFLLIRRCKYLVLFLSYLTLDNIMTLKIWLEVTHVIQTGTVQKLECGFLFAFHSNYSSILHQFRKSWFLSYPPCIRRPVILPSQWYRKTRMLPDGAKTLRIRLDTIPACDRLSHAGIVSKRLHNPQSYWQTDGRATCHGTVRAICTSRGKKWSSQWLSRTNLDFYYNNDWRRFIL